MQQPVARNRYLARAAASARDMLPDPKSFAQRLGPGLITGAADDDPSGIATYSQAGAQFRFGLVWTLLLTTPLMIGVQMLSARIGWATGDGLAANIAKICPRWLTMALVALLVLANTINIAADIGAMAEAVRLLAGGPHTLYIVAFGTVCVLGQVFFSFEVGTNPEVADLALLAYFAVVMTVHVPWQRATLGLQPWRFFPASSKAGEYANMVVAVLGPPSARTCSSGKPRRKSKTTAVVRTGAR